MKDLKVVFMGTPVFAVSILEALLENVKVLLVVSQPDKEVGRKRVLTPSPVKVCAESHGIEVFTPSKIREDYDRIKEINPDLIVTCAYGQIISKDILDIPRLGCINVHASLLPKYRGGAPIHRSILAGDKETGITIMYMDEGMDSGDMIKKNSIPITDEDTLDTLSNKLAVLGSKLLVETLPSIIDGTNERERQSEEEVSFARVITKADELLDFTKSSKEVYDKIRGLNSSPGAYFLMDGKHIKVYGARIGNSKGGKSQIINIYNDGIGIGTEDGEIVLTEIKPEGKNRISVKDYLNGIDKNKLKGKIINVEMD